MSPANGLNNWQKIEDKGYLTWVTRPSPLTYYQSLDGVIGLEYDILNQFCEFHGIKLTVMTADSNNEMFKMFDGYNIDVMGANLSLTEERIINYSPSLDYDETSVSFISSYRKPKIKSMDDLKNLKGAVIKNSSYEKIADSLIDNNQASIDFLDNRGLYELLQMVTNDEIDYTLSDTNIISIFGAYIPRLRVGEQLSGSNKIVFYTKKTEDNSLSDKLNAFIKKFKFQNQVNQSKKFIANSLPNIKVADTVQFLKNYKERWASIKPLIYSTAEKYELNPVFLGAISYQESHWNANAISPTLVKGMMMLTKAVAQEQNVRDRFNPLQSLEGGTKHFIKMKKRVPERITDPDRTHFALAAYNIGYGHLEKARVITQKAGKNPDIWDDVKLYLPVLNDPENYIADGKTAVRYVENIKVYQNLLQWKEQQ